MVVVDVGPSPRVDAGGALSVLALFVAGASGLRTWRSQKS